MADTPATGESGFRHSQVQVGGSSLHVVQAGDPDQEAVLFLHGWPQTWQAWSPVMRLAAAQQVHAVAVDLPGIGRSTGDAGDGTKHAVAQILHAAIDTLDLGKITVVGHDAGAMVGYAYLRDYAEDLNAAVIMDVAVAGVPPWEQLTQGGGPWHFGFHAIPDLPEQLVQGHQSDYFGYFYDAFSANPAAITPHARAAYADAYTSDTALSAGFNWYRTFPLDAEHNQRHTTPLGTPTLIMLSDRMRPLTAAFEEGFRGAGLTDVRHAVIPDTGHFLQEENPTATWQLITTMLQNNP